MLVMRVAEVRGQNFAKLNPPEVPLIILGHSRHFTKVLQIFMGLMIKRVKKGSDVTWFGHLFFILTQPENLG